MLLLVALGLAVGIGFAGYDSWVRPGTPPKVDENRPQVVQIEPENKVGGDPLPAGAVVRLGQDRWLHDIAAHFAAFLPDGMTVVTVNDDRTIRVWEFPSGKEIRRIPLPAPDPSAKQSGEAETALT